MQTALRLSRRSSWRRRGGRRRSCIHGTRSRLRHDYATDGRCGRSRRRWSGRCGCNRYCRCSSFGRLRRRYGSRSFAWCWRADCGSCCRGCWLSDNRSCGSCRSADGSRRRCCGLYHNWRCRHRRGNRWLRFSMPCFSGRGNRRPRYNRTCRRLGGNRWRRWRLHNRRSLPGQRHNSARRGPSLSGSYLRRRGNSGLRRCWRDNWRRSGSSWLCYSWRRCWPAGC